MLDLNTQFAIVFTIQTILMVIPILILGYLSNRLVALLRDREGDN